MKVAVFSTKSYDQTYLGEANEQFGHDLTFFPTQLRAETCVLARNFPVVCAFVNDELGACVLKELQAHGTRLLALRCAGFNNVDLKAAWDLGLLVVNVPSYSPNSVAEHTVALTLALNRKIHRAYARVREGNFSLEGLLGFELAGRTVGIVGTGQIGSVVARILRSFGCRVLAFDVTTRPDLQEQGVAYVPLEDIFLSSDILSLHCPLTPETHHLIDRHALRRMKHGVMLINTSRGGLVDTKAIIEGLKSGRIGALAIDVYEEEAHLFFEDLSDSIIQDDVFARLLTFPNVLITAHQGFFTHEALRRIAQTTLENISEFERGASLTNQVTLLRWRNAEKR